MLLLAVTAALLAPAAAAAAAVPDVPDAAPAPGGGAAASAAADAAAPPRARANATEGLFSWRPGRVRALLLTDCAKYQDWQAIAAAFAWRESGQPGGFTHVANCADKERAAYPKGMLAYAETHFAPQVRTRRRR